MKILFLFSNYHLSHITAQPGIAYKLGHKASEKNHEVWILSNTTEEIKTTDKKIKLILIPGLGDLKSYVLNFHKIIGALLKIKPERVHIHGNLLTILFWLLNLVFHIKFTVYISETIDILDNKYKKIFIYTLRSAQHIFVSSEYVKQQLISGGIAKENISICRLGVDDVFYAEPKKLPLEFDVLFFGDSKTERGFDTVAKLAKSLPKLKVLILLRWKEGSGQEYLDLAKKLPNTTVMQYPYPDPLYNYIAKSKVVLLPFRFMGVRPPISILEAMIMGKCLITSTMEGNSEVINNGKNGILADFNDLDKTKTILTKLITDDKTRDEMGKEARKTILRLYTSKEYEDVINTITDK